MTGGEAVLDVRGLTVCYPTQAGSVLAVRDVSFSLAPGETLAVIGESGCGKSTLGRALAGLLPRPGRITAGSVALCGQAVERLTQRQWQPLRGRRVSMLLQDPMLALTPVLPIGLQVAETLRDIGGRTPSSKERRERGLAALEGVGLREPDRVWRSYPFQLSGGMLQRVALAIALINRPTVLIADEPTTALDVGAQAEVLDALGRLQQEMGLAVLLVTHDVGVAARADRVAVLYGGRLAEIGRAARLLASPAHPYTLGLLGCLPAPGGELPRPLPGQPPSLLNPPDRCLFLARCARGDVTCATGPYPAPASDGDSQSACYHPVPAGPPALVADGDERGRISGRGGKLGERLLVARDLRKRYRAGGVIGGVTVHALRGATLDVRRGEVVGLVGPSGCGKSTLARCILRLEPSDAGSVHLEGADVTRLRGGKLRALRRRMQPVFQDARGSLNPRRTALECVRAPLDYFGIGTSAERSACAASMLERAGISAGLHGRLPGALSSGQCQRVAIARALAPSPELLVCDEPVSALDLSVQAQILQLLHELQQELGFGMLFITHNLSVVEALAHRVVVMEAGQTVDVLDLTGGSRLADEARHPASRALAAAVPVLPRVHTRERSSAAALH